jgi:hypothetical protein
VTAIILLCLAALSGIFGRMGGAGRNGQWYEDLLDTKWRDIGCSVIIVIATILLTGWHPDRWWAYVMIFGLSWAAFSTYWDWLFGYDNLFFSGLMAGAAWLPVLSIQPALWPVAAIRIVVLATAWWALNKKLPNSENRDKIEEYWRYFISL